jgi:O-antigen/teichoic acid export membrane protein
MISSDTEAALVEESAPSYDHCLKTHAVAGDLNRKSARGAAATGANQAANFILRLGSTAVLARLLTPHDYGLVGMTAVITGFVAMFKDAGLTSATIQRAEISQAQVSMLFWINLLLGCMIAAVLVAISPVVAAIYREPRLTGITCALAVPFVFGGLTLQHQALLRRQMRFDLLAIIDIASVTAGIGVGIVMAWRGFGYWSLAGMSISTAAVNAAGVWLAMPWRPGRPRRNSGVRPLLKFGRDLLGFDMVHYFASQADSFLIGWFWGPAPLAFYQKCYVLMMQPVQQIASPFGAVIMPALSRLQSDPARFRRFYLGVLQLTTSLSLPLVCLIALFAREIVLVVLGPAWLDSVPLFRLLAPAAAVTVMTYPWGMLLISLGQTRKYRVTGIACAALVVASFLIGVPFGVRGVALAYSIALCLVLVPSQWFITKDTPITMGDVFQTWVPPFFAAILAAIASLLISKLAMAGLSQWISALTSASVFGGVYLLVLLVGFGKWSFFLRILRELKRK